MRLQPHGIAARFLHSDGMKEKKAKSPEAVALGLRIKAARARTGHPGREIAHRAGLDPGHYNTIENGGTATGAATVARIAAALGVEPRELLEEKTDKRSLPRGWQHADERSLDRVVRRRAEAIALALDAAELDPGEVDLAIHLAEIVTRTEAARALVAKLKTAAVQREAESGDQVLADPPSDTGRRSDRR